MKFLLMWEFLHSKLYHRVVHHSQAPWLCRSSLRHWSSHNFLLYLDDLKSFEFSANEWIGQASCLLWYSFFTWLLVPLSFLCKSNERGIHFRICPNLTSLWSWNFPSKELLSFKAVSPSLEILSDSLKRKAKLFRFCVLLTAQTDL